MEFVIGVAIMGFSIYVEMEKSDAINRLQIGNDNLDSSMKSLSEQRRIDSANNSSFQKYLKMILFFLLQKKAHGHMDILLLIQSMG